MHIVYRVKYFSTACYKKGQMQPLTPFSQVFTVCFHLSSLFKIASFLFFSISYGFDFMLWTLEFVSLLSLTPIYHTHLINSSVPPSSDIIMS